MSYYSERNGLARMWDRDYRRLEYAKWVYHHPDIFQAFVDKLAEYGIDLFDKNSNVEHEFNIQIIVDQIDQLTKEEIDEITGVDLDG